MLIIKKMSSQEILDLEIINKMSSQESLDLEKANVFSLGKMLIQMILLISEKELGVNLTARIENELF